MSFDIASVEIFLNGRARLDPEQSSEACDLFNDISTETLAR